MFVCQNAKFRFGIYWQFWCSEAIPTNHFSGYRTHNAMPVKEFMVPIKRYLLWLPFATIHSSLLKFVLVVYAKMCKNAKNCTFWFGDHPANFL